MTFVVNFSTVIEFKFGDWNILSGKADFINKKLSFEDDRIAWYLITGNINISRNQIEVNNLDQPSVSEHFQVEPFFCCFFYFFVGSEE